MLRWVAEMSKTRIQRHLLFILISVLGGLLWASAAMAADAAGGGKDVSGGAWDVFLFGGDDISLITLKEIIGDWSGLSPTIQPIFSDAMLVFNLAVLAFGSAIFAYTAIVGTLQSAHDGQLLGKNWSTVWVPLRFTAGISFLVPTASGLCLAQLGMIWLLSQGVGLASNVWQSAVEGYSKNGGQYIAGKMASESTIREAMQGIFANELCMAVMRRTSDSASFSRREVTTLTGAKEIRWGGDPGSGYDDDVCGSVTVSSASDLALFGEGLLVSNTMNEVKKKLSVAQYDALMQASLSFEGVAERIMSILPDKELTTTQKVDEVHQKIGAAYVAYRDKITAEISAAVTKGNEVLTKQLQDSAQRDGWFTAGTWFYQIARSNEELNSLVSAMPTVTTKISENAMNIASGETLVVDGLPANEREYIKKILSESNKVFARNTKSLAYEKIDPGTHKNGFIYILQGMNLGGVSEGGAHSDMATEFGYDPTNPAPAIIQLKNVGDYMITGAISALAVAKASEILAADGSGKASATIGDTIRSLASKAGPIGMVVQKLGAEMMGYLSALMMFIGIALFATGIILAFWLPILPFVNWIGGIIGWVVASLEMLIATPVWLAAHLHPEGEGVASRYAASGYMIILELLLRPVLMVFGLIIAIIIADPILNFVATQFFHAFASTGEDSMKLLVAWIMKLVIFTVVCWIAVNFTFKAINSVPNGVMRWIGGMAGSNSDMGESVGENTRAMVVAGSHKMTGALQMGKADNAARAAKSRAQQFRNGAPQDDPNKGG